MNEQEEKQESHFSPEQLNAFRLEFKKFKNEEEFFLAKKCIKISDNGTWITLQFPEIVEDPITGMLAGDIPFRFYRRIIRQIEKEDQRISFADKKRFENYQTYPEAEKHNPYSH